MLNLNANDLQIKKVQLVVGLNAKFVHIEETNTFKNKDEEEMFDIGKWILNCNSNLLVYLIECKLSSRQHVVSTFTYSVHTHFKNYEIRTREVSKVFLNKYNVYQKKFRHHFNSADTIGWSAERLLSLTGLRMF